MNEQGDEVPGEKDSLPIPAAYVRIEASVEKTAARSRRYRVEPDENILYGELQDCRSPYPTEGAMSHRDEQFSRETGKGRHP